MSDHNVTRSSRKFYEQFPFPGNRPIDRDGLIFLRWFMKAVAHRASSNPNLKLRVLDAGCGTGNTLVSLARQFPNVSFHGLDNSNASLEIAVSSARKRRLTNLHFRRWNIMRPLPYTAPFDIILCLGVLHHTADMQKGLKNIQRVLKYDGYMCLWIYGRHGRYRHSLNMRLLDMLLRVPPKPEDSVELARQFAGGGNGGNVLHDLLGNTPVDATMRAVLENPVWIADQFLNPREILLDMEELIEMTRATGFDVEQVFGLDDDISGRLNSPALYERFQKLSADERLIAMDLLLKPERYFVALRNTRS